MLLLTACTDPSAPGQATPGDGFVFSRPVLGRRQLFAMDANGANLRQITNTDGTSETPVWSPDGRAIAYTSSRDDGIRHVWVMRPDGSGARRVTSPEHGDLTGPVTWSPDGSMLAFVCRDPDDELLEKICVIGEDGAGFRRLLAAGWRGIQPAWSPDGSVIAFAGWSADEPGYLHLWKVSPAGGTPTLLSAAMGLVHEEEPAWSPDGQWIAFRTTRPRPPFAPGLPEVFIMRADRTGRRPLIDDMNPQEGSGDAEWSPDGQRIAFVRYGETSRMFIASADGSSAAPLDLDATGIHGLSWTERTP